MRIVQGLENYDADKPSVLTVGSFDGVHLGHQRILQMMQKAGGGVVSVLTFEPHPQSVVRPDVVPPPLITTRQERLSLFSDCGVEQLIIARFDLEFAGLSAEEYIRRILIDRLKVTRIFVGPNHRFGQKRSGDVDLLREAGGRSGFDLQVVEPLEINGEIISSSRIRRKLLAGETDSAGRMLGRPFYLTGAVVRGEGRGRKLGFPTANLGEPEPGKLVPPDGIYATVTWLGNQRWNSVTHIGPRPTFPGNSSTVETHLIGFDGDLYNSVIRVGLVARMRGIIAYQSVEALISQMEKDRLEAVRILEAADTI
jgi:riboflavin kinase/FMN adenylyltransferase